ncbi:MAG: 2-amino-4-oxopentanoate thiolase subunit OrtA [Gammaproteobacteria bacterium]|nr:2-amino-4-oxopentanoate thiolase subunit OrtA [Gammaproteobacteria bacterium]
MSERVAAGTLVEIHAVVLAPGERAPQVPEDTRGLPLEMRVKGVLVGEANVGAQAEIRTATGRHLQGTLVDSAPAYTHTFGPGIAELTPIGAELREILRRRGHSR